MKAELNKKSIEKYLTSVDDHLDGSIKALEGAVIGDDADYTACCETLFSVTEYKTEVAEEKDKVISAAKLIIETVSGWFSPREKKIAAHIEHVKGLVRDYNIQQEDERQKTLRSATKLAKVDPKAARELNSKAEAVLPPKVKGIAFVGKLDVKVTDESKLPEAFFKKVVDVAKLNAAVEAGEITDWSKYGVLVTDMRTVRVTPSQRGES